MMHVLADETRPFSFPPKLFARLGVVADDISLSEPAARGAKWSMADRLPSRGSRAVDEELIHRADLDGLISALADLDGKEREVMKLRYGLDDDEPRTLEQVGARLRLSRERVRQIESRACDKLRRSAKLRKLGN
jgi:RNA polymerase sigma factor (sigma-70 family)